MKQSLSPFLLALILVSQPWSTAAQVAGDDRATIAIHAGAVTPTTTLPDGSTHESGTAIGASGAWWVLRNLGLRAHVTRSYTEGVQGADFSAAAANAGRVWLYGAEAVIRLPLMNGRVAPYLTAGPGGKSYRWKYGMYEGGTAFAWSYAGGLDLRPVQSVRACRLDSRGKVPPHRVPLARAEFPRSATGVQENLSHGKRLRDLRRSLG